MGWNIRYYDYPASEVVSGVPTWSEAPVLSVSAGDVAAFDLPVTVEDGSSITVTWVQPGTKPSWVEFAPGNPPTITFQGNQVDANDVSGLVLRATANSLSVDSDAGSITVYAAPSASVLAFTSLPSLEDERGTYASLGWSQLAGAESFVFTYTPNGTYTGLGTVNIHNDSEADDLWTWDAQYRRGYPTGNATLSAYRASWLDYFRNGHYRADLTTAHGDTSANTAGDMCHTYGVGLVRYGLLSSDAAAIAEAEAIADIATFEQYGATTAPGAGSGQLTANYDLGFNARGNARLGALICWLVYATGKAKWTNWLKWYIDAYLGASTYESVTVGGNACGGYFTDKVAARAHNYYLGWIGTTQFDYSNGGALSSQVANDAAYDDGVRYEQSWIAGLHNEFLWRAFLLTGRSDLRQRLIDNAYFFLNFGHDPLQTAAGGPYVGGHFGKRGTSIVHAQYDAVKGAAATFDQSLINGLIRGYKLTGNAAMLTKARTMLRNCTLYNEEQPGATGQAAFSTASQIKYFFDVRNESNGSIYFTNNKGMLQYAYQVFENAGNPPTKDSDVPSYIRNLADGSVATVASKVTDPWVTFSGFSGAAVGIMNYSGGCYDTSRHRFMVSGGGHGDYNGNEVVGISIYGSETPTWQRITQPEANIVNTEFTPSGQAASNHTYNALAYDAHADKFVKCGMAVCAGPSPQSVARFRLLNLATGAWDASSDALKHAYGGAMYSAAFAYDSLGKQIIGRGGDAGTPYWHRYDCQTGTLASLSVSGVRSQNSIDTAAAINPIGRYFVLVGGYGLGPVNSSSVSIVVLDLASLSGNAITGYEKSIAGFPADLLWDKSGFEFHPPSGTFVIWRGNQTIYRLIPPANPLTGTWTYDTRTVAGLPTMYLSDTGIYGRFRWAPYPHDPSRGVFVMTGKSGAGVASNTFVYKPDF